MTGTIIPDLLALHRDSKSLPARGHDDSEFKSEWMNALAVEIEELVEVLRPLAMEYEDIPDGFGDEQSTVISIQFGAIRQARALLAALEDTSGVERLG